MWMKHLSRCHITSTCANLTAKIDKVLFSSWSFFDFIYISYRTQCHSEHETAQALTWQIVQRLWWKLLQIRKINCKRNAMKNHLFCSFHKMRRRCECSQWYSVLDTNCIEGRIDNLRIEIRNFFRIRKFDGVSLCILSYYDVLIELHNSFDSPLKLDSLRNQSMRFIEYCLHINERNKSDRYTDEWTINKSQLTLIEKCSPSSTFRMLFSLLLLPFHLPISNFYL